MNLVGNQSEIIAVAMSGGVDSSVAAARLKEQGHNIFGITAKMTDEYSRCCADEDIKTAQKVARTLGIRHEVVEVVEDFRKSVISYFVDSSLAGLTPSPCVECNRLIKFGSLLKAASTMGAHKLATGHYVRTGFNSDGNIRLLRGADARKDQSYFLTMLDQDQLKCAIFPLGEMKKQEVIAYAAARGLESKDRGESQELCFIGEEGHGAWIDVRSMKTKGAGDIVDTSGRTLGKHRGIHYYTVGQRKGLGLASGRPLYVAGIDAGNNRIIVGSREDACVKGMIVRGAHWIAGKILGPSFSCLTQIRYNHTAAKAVVSVLADGSLSVAFEEPQFAVTPGQLAAFYDGDELLGGGWIEKEMV
jgi:tRNA-uridine 2-sulfurtransferase